VVWGALYNPLTHAKKAKAMVVGGRGQTSGPLGPPAVVMMTQANCVISMPVGTPLGSEDPDRSHKAVGCFVRSLLDAEHEVGVTDLHGEVPDLREGVEFARSAEGRVHHITSLLKDGLGLLIRFPDAPPFIGEPLSPRGVPLKG
jgi:hypothetical protein